MGVDGRASDAGGSLLVAVADRLEGVSRPDSHGWHTALCPYHDDQRHPNLRFRPTGFRCMACGERGKLEKLAAKLGIPVEGQLKIRAPKPLPQSIVADLREAKAEVLVELTKRLRSDSQCWVLEEWRRTSIPQWRRVPRESEAEGSTKRAEYALWMLGEVLEDPEYQEEMRDD